MQVFSIGYQGKTVKLLCQALLASNIEAVIDVRAVAWSQRPEFRKGALAAALLEHGIRYVHCKVAGNPFRPRRGVTADFAECERAYRRHLKEHPEVILVLREEMTRVRSALLCYEADRKHCHRGTILRALARGLSVEVVDL